MDQSIYDDLKQFLATTYVAGLKQHGGLLERVALKPAPLGMYIPRLIVGLFKPRKGDLGLHSHPDDLRERDFLAIEAARISAILTYLSTLKADTPLDVYFDERYPLGVSALLLEAESAVDKDTGDEYLSYHTSIEVYWKPALVRSDI